MDLQRLHLQLAKLTNPQDAAVILREFVAEFGATSAIFTSYVVGDPTLDSYRFILAADQALCDTYQKRYWFLNDPCTVYANSNTEPIRINMLPVATAAQREILDESAKYGFRSGFIVPVHGSASSSRAGVLFVGSDDPQRFVSRDSFDSIRPTARLLAIELYDFILSMVRRQLLDAADLSTDDLAILRMQRDGFQSKDMAKVLSTTPAAVDKRFTRLNQRLGVATRRQAADLVAQYGILA